MNGVIACIGLMCYDSAQTPAALIDGHGPDREEEWGFSLRDGHRETMHESLPRRHVVLLVAWRGKNPSSRDSFL
ncbi:hypothetical protein KOW79_006767 [Hemibagrus wyckioides]|uniref:Uncharacterized protein n=1 Tax=Hemibagrus wyckioides TaxID=337641 RepID=A0A9D3SPA8_9TELE|nr:hypothetical protein KOW79_006767 [Hemibagrus wyckioides]